MPPALRIRACTDPPTDATNTWPAEEIPTAGWLADASVAPASAVNAPPELETATCMPAVSVHATAASPLPFAATATAVAVDAAGELLVTVQVPAAISAVSTLPSRSQAAAPAGTRRWRREGRRSFLQPSGALNGVAAALHTSPFHEEDSIVLPSIQNTVGTPLTIAACGELAALLVVSGSAVVPQASAPGRRVDVSIRAHPGRELRTQGLCKVWCRCAGIRVDAARGSPRRACRGSHVRLDPRAVRPDGRQVRRVVESRDDARGAAASRKRSPSSEPSWPRDRQSERPEALHLRKPRRLQGGRWRIGERLPSSRSSPELCSP